MQNAIDTWLNGPRNYAAGVALYEKYGTDNFLKKIFAQGDRGFNKSKLVAALTELRDKVPQPKADHKVYWNDGKTIKEMPVGNSDAKGQSIVHAVIDLNDSTLAQELLKVTKERDNTYGELRGLHPYLVSAAEGDELFALAQRIARLGKKTVEKWATYDHLIEHGVPPAAPPVMVDLSLINEYENLRKSTSKAERRAKDQNPVNPKTLELIRKNKARMGELKVLIDAQKAGGKK